MSKPSTEISFGLCRSLLAPVPLHQPGTEGRLAQTQAKGGELANERDSRGDKTGCSPLRFHAVDLDTDPSRTPTSEQQLLVCRFLLFAEHAN
jgi:hypothetical protein